MGMVNFNPSQEMSKNTPPTCFDLLNFNLSPIPPSPSWKPKNPKNNKQTPNTRPKNYLDWLGYKASQLPRCAIL
jgi:hypothetical protein